jgi:hypothetical protein
MAVSWIVLVVTYLVIVQVALGDLVLPEIYTKNCISPPSPDYPHYNLYVSSSNKSFIPRYLQLPENAPSLKPDFQTKTELSFKSFSQSGQDFAILSILNDMSNGYFIDLAANDYKVGSNTLCLEQFNNWSGVCIEPNSKYWMDILSHRRCKLYVNPVSTKEGEKVTFRLSDVFGGIVGDEFDQKENSRGNDATVELETTTLTHILDDAKAPQVINYMSLDIEGAEYFAMTGFDFNKYSIWLLNVERPKPRLHLLFAKHGYVYLHAMTSYGDVLYVHHSMPNFDSLFAAQFQNFAPTWFGEAHHYFLAPAWKGNVKQYMEEAAKLYHHHKP